MDEFKTYQQLIAEADEYERSAARADVELQVLLRKQEHSRGELVYKTYEPPAVEVITPTSEEDLRNCDLDSIATEVGIALRKQRDEMRAEFNDKLNMMRELCEVRAELRDARERIVGLEKQLHLTHALATGEVASVSRGRTYAS
jgi:hypothetical protein